MKVPKKVKQGKRNRVMGADFERRTRKDLESKGWIVSKWVNNVEFIKSSCPYCDELQGVEGEQHRKNCKMGNWDIGKCIPAKPSRFQLHGTGFPDFIAYKKAISEEKWWKRFGLKEEECSKLELNYYEIIFIECKVNGKLSKIEKEKAYWYLKNNYCSKFYIAYKTKEKNKVKVNYKEVTLE